MKEIDTVIIGGGIAGLSCALYAKRAGLRPVVFEKNAAGGQLLYISSIDNYPGLPSRTQGLDLLKNLNNSVSELGIEIRQEAVTQFAPRDGFIEVTTVTGPCKARSAVIATGASFKKLGVAGEDEFSGKGVSWCAMCDGYFFKNKDVVVVGGGNTACEDALYLSNICKKVTLVHRRESLRAMHYLQEQLKEKDTIDLMLQHVVTEIKGKDFLNEVIVKSTADGSVRSLSCAGAFIAIGVHPNTGPFKEDVPLDAGGFILTDEEMRTSCEGVWACGDCRKRPLRQLITAAAEGATAAISVYKYLKGQYISI